MARSTHLNGVSEPNASMDVQEKNTGAATSSSRSHRHSRFLKSLSSPFPFLALLKSRSDGQLRHSPLPLPRPTRKQTTRCNSQTGKRTGSRKKNTETARGQRPEWGGHGPKWPGGVRGAGGHSWAPLRNVLLTGVSFLQTKSSRPDTSSASSCLLQTGASEDAQASTEASTRSKGRSRDARVSQRATDAADARVSQRATNAAGAQPKEAEAEAGGGGGRDQEQRRRW